MAWNEERDCTVCGEVSGMSAGEGGTLDDNQTSSNSVDSGMKVAAHQYGFRRCITP